MRIAVRPWSHGAGGRANDQQQFVLSTGGRSETYSMRQSPDLLELAFIEMSEFTCAALEQGALGAGSVRLSWCASVAMRS